MKKQFAKIIVTILLAMLVVTALAACKGFGKQVPIYQGMTVSDSPALYAYVGTHNGPVRPDGHGEHGDDHDHHGWVDGDYDGRTHDFNPDKPFDPDVPTIEDKAASTLDVIGAGADIYYADAGQDVYITVRISNPDSYEIMSFTLNGKKYSSYMFEGGSDMENLVLKVDKNSLGGGINEYTIDAIKYVDGTDIKDVRMDGDRTVKIGIRIGDDMTRAIIANEQIGLTSVQFDVSVVDDYSLISRSEGYAKAALYDGLKMIYKDVALDGTTTHVAFDNLLPNTLYQYAVVALYDNLGGDGVQLNTLHKRSFYTDTIVLFADVELNQTGASWDYTWHESAKNKQITALQLTKDGSKVRDLSADTTSVDGLLSDNQYTLTATYKNTYGADENIEINFATVAKTIPTAEISNVASTQTEVTFDISVTDVDNVGTIKSIELLHENDQPIVVLNTTDRIFANLLSNNAYTVQVTYEYDLNDGNGIQYIVKTHDITTQAKHTPSVKIYNATSTRHAIETDLSFVDPNNIGTITEVALYKGEEKITTTNQRDHIAFDKLNDDTCYTILTTFVFDLNDGKGQQTRTSSCEINTLSTFFFDFHDSWAEIVNADCDEGEILVVPDYVNGLPVKKIGAAFRYAKLQRIELPDTLEEIGEQAFYDATVNEEIVLPRNLQTLGCDAFCNFYGKITFANDCHIKAIGEKAFNCAKLDSVLVLPGTVTRIEKGAFCWTALRGLVLNEGLTYIGENGINILGGMYVYLPSTVKNCGKPGTEVFISSENSYALKGTPASSHTVRLHVGNTVTSLSGECIVLPDQTQEGKRFLGWKDTDGGYVQQVYCPTWDVDLYASFADSTEADGTTAETPLVISDGESIEVTLTGLDNLYFMIDTDIASSFTVIIEIDNGYGHGFSSASNLVIFHDFTSVAKNGDVFDYTPKTLLRICPFTGGIATMVNPFTVKLTVIAM